MAQYGKEGKWFKVLSRHDTHARSSVQIECPFCQEEFKAYIWSMAGGGKKCPSCGAIHYMRGNAYPEIKKK